MTIAVIGAGPAGLSAAIAAAENGARVTIFEKNEQAGIKLLRTGNGRCNLTNRMPLAHYPDQYFGNGAFLYPALHFFGPEKTEHFFEDSGVPLAEENEGRVFPQSGRASDILAALTDRAQRLGVQCVLREKVVALQKDEDGFISFLITEKERHKISACVLCAGGKSAPITGSSGDGVIIASRLGHTITDQRPALAPIDLSISERPNIPGVALRDVRLSLFRENKLIRRRSGDVLFTHHGLSGPAVLPLARDLPYESDAYGGQIRIELSLFPDIKREDAEEHLLQWVGENRNNRLIFALQKRYPASFLAHLFERSGVSDQVYGCDLKRKDRTNLLKSMYGLSYTVIGPPSFLTAMVTAGGVSLREVDPKTMQSKRVGGLFFAGEVLDIDGESGGFNLQAAFSTGFLAGHSAARFVVQSGRISMGDR